MYDPELFNERGCLSKEALKKYTLEHLTFDQLYVVQSHLNSCELCTDAADGFAILSGQNDQLPLIKDEIATRISKTSNIKIHGAKRITNTQLFVSLAIAASIIIGFILLIPETESPGISINSDTDEMWDKKSLKGPSRPAVRKSQSQVSESEIPVVTNDGSKKLTQAYDKNIDRKYEGTVFTLTDEMPEFPGGISALDSHIRNRIQIAGQENNLRSCGLVYVKFVVNENGKIGRTSIIKGHNPELDKIALEVVQDLPAWEPGRQSGELVKVEFTLPIRFDNC